MWHSIFWSTRPPPEVPSEHHPKFFFRLGISLPFRESHSDDITMVSTVTSFRLGLSPSNIAPTRGDHHSQKTSLPPGSYHHSQKRVFGNTTLVGKELYSSIYVPFNILFNIQSSERNHSESTYTQKGGGAKSNNHSENLHFFGLFAKICGII